MWCLPSAKHSFRCFLDCKPLNSQQKQLCIETFPIWKKVNQRNGKSNSKIEKNMSSWGNYTKWLAFQRNLEICSPVPFLPILRVGGETCDFHFAILPLIMLRSDKHTLSSTNSPLSCNKVCDVFNSKNYLFIKSTYFTHHIKFTYDKF